METNVYYESYYIFFDVYWVDLMLYRFSLILQQYIWQVPYIYILATQRRRRRCCAFGRREATVDEILNDCEPSELSDASYNLLQRRSVSSRGGISDQMQQFSPRDGNEDAPTFA